MAVEARAMDGGLGGVYGDWRGIDQPCFPPSASNVTRASKSSVAKINLSGVLPQDKGSNQLPLVTRPQTSHYTYANTPNLEKDLKAQTTHLLKS